MIPDNKPVIASSVVGGLGYVLEWFLAHVQQINQILQFVVLTATIAGMIVAYRLRRKKP